MDRDRRLFLKGAAALAAVEFGGDNTAEAQSKATQPEATKAQGVSPSGQATGITSDIVSPFVCSSWEDVKDIKFDVIVIGAGMFGGYLADKLYRKTFPLPDDPKDPVKILVVDQGPLVLPTHYQNLGRYITASIVAYPAPPIDPLSGDGLGQYRDFVWNAPWSSDKKFRGQAYCLGGRSLFWAGWSPRLTSRDLHDWPCGVRDHLIGNPDDGYARVENEIGASRNTGQDLDYIQRTALFEALNGALRRIAPKNRKRLVENITEYNAAPLAVVASSPQPGLFPISKFSSASFLINAVCEDRQSGKERRLFVLPKARVLQLEVTGTKDNVSKVHLSVEGEKQVRSIVVPAASKVVLANGTIEATRLALNDLGIGKPVQNGRRRATNLMAHLRSNIWVRIQREALVKFGLPISPNDTGVEVAAFIIRGEAQDRRFHLQTTAASSPNQGDVIWSMVPDVELVDRFIANQDDQMITISFNVVGEMAGAKRQGESFIENTVDPYPNDTSQRVKVHLAPSKGDLDFWKTIDIATLRLANELAGPDHPVEYLHDAFKGKTLKQIESEFDKLVEQWPAEEERSWRDPIGFSHHEGGTLFMGESEKDGSVTDANGRFHNIKNAYVAGPALFPTVGSANPSLTGLSLARLTAQAIIDDLNKRSVVSNLSILTKDNKLVGLENLAPDKRLFVERLTTDQGLAPNTATSDQLAEGIRLAVKSADELRKYREIANP